MTWLIASGTHPKATETTARVARDLATRMDYHEGTVIYALDTTALRLRLSRATVKRHVAVLRELGALAWVIHGSRRNLRKPGRPYTATATIYAAVIPPTYDHAMGHRLTGTGYTARLIGTTPDGHARRAAATATARHPHRASPKPPPKQANSPTTEPDPGSRDAPPSPNAPTPLRRSRPTSGFKNTHARRSTRVAPAPTPNDPPNGRARQRRSPPRVARDIAIAARVRTLVAWTAHETLRRLAWALRPLIDRGLDAPRIAGELVAWHLDGLRPLRPAAFVTARLRREAELDAQREAEHAAAVHPMSNPAWRECVRLLYPADAAQAPPRTDAIRREARTAGRHDLVRVIEHLEHDFPDAVDLYGADLVRRAGNLAASTTIHWGTH
ncbi:cell wall protein [Embleya sp. NPDC001921]